MGTKQIRPLVLAYLGRHPNRALTVDEIARETRLAGPQVQAVMYRLIATGRVEVITRGHAWVWRPDTSDTPPPKNPQTTHSQVVDKLEVVGRTRDGAMLARDPDGLLYTVKALDL